MLGEARQREDITAVSYDKLSPAIHALDFEDRLSKISLACSGRAQRQLQRTRTAELTQTTKLSLLRYTFDIEDLVVKMSLALSQATLDNINFINITRTYHHKAVDNRSNSISSQKSPPTSYCQLVTSSTEPPQSRQHASFEPSRRKLYHLRQPERRTTLSISQPHYSHHIGYPPLPLPPRLHPSALPHPLKSGSIIRHWRRKIHNRRREQLQTQDKRHKTQDCHTQTITSQSSRSWPSQIRSV